MEYILSLSYGKDSLACFGACEILGWPIDRVVTAEVWATDTLPADLPPMVEFKDHADRIIKERWGIEVEHIRCRNTYQDVFYRRKSTMAKKNPGQIRGWPMRGGPGGAWCQGDVKLPALRKINNKRRDRNVMYLGIAADEPDRTHILSDKDSPVTFHSDGHTVHDFDRRFQMEDEGLIYPDDKIFRWDMLDKELNYRWF